ncbi:hypothetical protein GPECTOR_31g338 [Gonium pectorale]|uniref:Uncharacterized protein n=1 Tax=Gonium pectorale TaxID=33097 RepID=A0A150GDS2_GONPE|nr:hypothetical protein GPECTOR_31g338 [Gonium pectorale]|eukprot:KXZ47976.1 hypothetical protein GPECTOR_31g338 [Gonium pectorale]
MPSGVKKLVGIGANSVRAVGSAIGEAIREGLRGVQKVVVIAEPGPLGGRLGRWEYSRQAAAEAEVRQAVTRFRQDAARSTQPGL